MMLTTQSRRRTNSEAPGTFVRPERLLSPLAAGLPQPVIVRQAEKRGCPRRPACLYFHCIYRGYQEGRRSSRSVAGATFDQGPSVLLRHQPLQPVDEIERLARAQLVGV